MKATKTFKTKIGAKFAILLSRIKNKFNGSKLVVEDYVISYNTITKEYTVTCNTMTEAQDKEFTELLTSVMTKISNMTEPEQPTPGPDEVATLERQKSKEEKWAEDVERNRQKQLAENKVKKPAKPKVKKPVELSDEAAEKIVTDIKNRGAYNGEPKIAAKTKKTAKVKVTNVKNKTK